MALRGGEILRPHMRNMIRRHESVTDGGSSQCCSTFHSRKVFDMHADPRQFLCQKLRATDEVIAAIV
jgi:hypothetical protein